MENTIYFGNNLPVLQKMKAESVHLIYIDPPFNTGRTQARTQIRTVRSDEGDRVGFAEAVEHHVTGAVAEGMHAEQLVRRATSGFD